MCAYKETERHVETDRETHRHTHRERKLDSQEWKRCMYIHEKRQRYFSFTSLRDLGLVTQCLRISVPSREGNKKVSSLIHAC